MTPNSWKRLEEVYHSARGHPPAERAAYLADACKDDEQLRLEIESLLVHDDALSKLESAVLFGTAETALGEAAMVGPYRIEERLDAGGMGVVYRALDTRLGRQVAIKIGLARFSDRFHREARTIAKLNHVNVCTLHDIGSTPEIPGYLVMEFVEGPTLAKRLESGSMPIAEAVQIAHQMAAALTSAHEQGIVHRDLKPANVKITPQGVVKVLDFGLAKGFPMSDTEVPAGTLGRPQARLSVRLHICPWNRLRARNPTRDRTSSLSVSFSMKCCVAADLSRGTPLQNSDHLCVKLNPMPRAD